MKSHKFGTKKVKIVKKHTNSQITIPIVISRRVDLWPVMSNGRTDGQTDGQGYAIICHSKNKGWSAERQSYNKMYLCSISHVHPNIKHFFSLLR